MWSSCPWVRSTARSRSSLVRRKEMSGRITSTPGVSSSGKARPAPIPPTPLPASSSARFLPISPTPPRGMNRRVPGAGSARKSPEPSSATSLEETKLLVGWCGVGRGERSRRGGGGGLVEVDPKALKVLAQDPQQAAVVQRRRGVVAGHVGPPALADQGAVRPRDPGRVRQQPLQRVPPQQEDDLRLHYLDLGVQVGCAGQDLLRQRVPIARRPGL